MKSKAIALLFKISLVLFLAALAGNLLLYAWEGISKTELFVLGATSFRVHLWTWGVCALFGMAALLLRAGQPVLILLPIAWLLVFFELLPAIWLIGGYRYVRQPRACPSSDGRRCVLIVYEGEIYRKENALFIRKICDLGYPLSMDFDSGIPFEERYKIEWLDDRALITCQNPDGGEVPAIVSVPLN